MAEWVQYNPNPERRNTGDCVVRAICAATGLDWDTVYTGLALQGFSLKMMPSNNYTWGQYLKSRKFVKRLYENDCPDCKTVADFADEHPKGIFILGTGEHAVTVIDGEVFDSWDSRNEIVTYYFTQEE